MFLLILILAVLLASIIYFAVKKSKVKVENEQAVVEDEGLPRFKFDD
jgi:uncharacterized protein YpmB